VENMGKIKLIFEEYGRREPNVVVVAFLEFKARVDLQYSWKRHCGVLRSRSVRSLFVMMRMFCRWRVVFSASDHF